MEDPLLHTNIEKSKRNRGRLAGMLVLAGSLALVYLWLQGFLIFTVELPANGIGILNSCIWQYSLSTDLIWRGNPAVSFVIILLLSFSMFFLRLARNKPNANLQLEFGILNLLFMAGGTALFVLISLVFVLISLSLRVLRPGK